LWRLLAAAEAERDHPLGTRLAVRYHPRHPEQSKVMFWVLY
jgi:hypothetical protein